MAEPKDSSKRSYEAESTASQAPRLVPGSSSKPSDVHDRQESSRDSGVPQINGELVRRVIDRLKGL